MNLIILKYNYSYNVNIYNNVPKAMVNVSRIVQWRVAIQQERFEMIQTIRMDKYSSKVNIVNTTSNKGGHSRYWF